MFTKIKFAERRDYSGSDARARSYRVGEVIKEAELVERIYDDDGDLIAETHPVGTRDAVVVGFGAMVTVGGNYYPVLLRRALGSKAILWEGAR